MKQLLILADSPEVFRELLRTTIAELLPAHSSTIAPDTAADLLTIGQVCQMLDVSKTTLSEWRQAGIIPYKRYGKRILFERQAVLQAGSQHEKYTRRAA